LIIISHQKKANATREQPKSKFFGGAPHHDPSDPMFRPYDMLLNPSTTAGNPLHELDRLKYPSVSSLGNTNKQQARPYSNQMPQNPARQQQYNPSKTSNLFRNAGNMMMDGTTEFQPLKQNNGLKGTANYGSALGMGDSVDQIMLRYNGAGGPSKRAGQYMNSPPGHGKGAGNRDSFELTGLGQTTGSVVPGGLHGDSTSNRNSFDIDKLISKNDERMKLLDKYKGLQMESIDEGFEGTNESMAFKGKVGKSKIPKASYLNDSAAIKSPPGLKESKTDMLAGGLGNNSMAADFDNLDAIINKYK
jgi:hypothetical protein